MDASSSKLLNQTASEGDMALRSGMNESDLELGR